MRPLQPAILAIQAQVREEQAAHRLGAAVLGLDASGVASVMEEVYRRRDLFATTWRTTRRHGGLGVTPTAAALESVYEDVARGWL